MKKILLWLDDRRDPFSKKMYWIESYSPIGKDVDVVWVKSYKEFVENIVEHGLPDGICFDHDLGGKKDGYDCAKWLINYCLDNNTEIPKYGIQSANTVGAINIDKLFKSFNKFQKEN